MEVTLHQRTLRLRKPFHAGTWLLDQRHIIIVRVHDTVTGHTGYGEASPLAAFGTETLEVCHYALQTFAQKYNGNSMSISEVSHALPGLLEEFSGSPCARCAVEIAVLDLCARAEGVPLSTWVNGKRNSTAIPVNAILGGSTVEHTVQDAHVALQQGFSCLKLKVGVASPETDIARVMAVRAAAGENTLLRLDANGAWSFDTACEMLTRMSPANIEYIEQPVRTVDELAMLRKLAIIPVAADEVLQDPAQVEFIITSGVADVLVLKPMVLGGVLVARDIALRAMVSGIDVVFTSFIDSAIARNAVGQLCASLPELQRHQGLATGILLLDDTGRDTINVGSFHLHSGPGLGLIPILGDSDASS